MILPTQAPHPRPHSRLWPVVLVVAVLGLIAGSYPIANTSIGWHLSSGHWILDHGEVPRTDPFSITSENAEWLDHEWGFQVIVALTEDLAGDSGLGLLRALLVSALAVLMFRFGFRSGLSPPAALLLASLCLYGARIRFFLRPELFTLLLAPSVVWLFLYRDRCQTRRWLLWIAVLMAVGANLHGGVLIIPILLAGILTAQWMQWLTHRKGVSPLPWGLAGLAVAAAAPLFNPRGWHLYAVPLKIAHLVGLEHIPNPEWISPSPADVPSLYVAMAVGLALLSMKERDVARWMLLLMASALALRYVRNVGLFFALYPIAIGPALAAFPLANLHHESFRRPIWRVTTLALACLVVGSMAAAPGHAPSWGFSQRYYPHGAWAFIEDNSLESKTMYNDVGFGGDLIRRHYPKRRTFLDDRNEIHEPLLEEIHSILRSSNPSRWQAMLDRYEVELALVRYNPPFTVARPDGTVVGRRGFSALWFPSDRWALLYWDDAAMVFADRTTIDSGLIARHEYRVIRPDDTEELERRLAADPSLKAAFAAELARVLEQQPDSERALALSQVLME